MYYFDPNLILIIILSIIAGGLMKGILGLGMPMVAVPVIAYFLPPTTAMMLLCFPILSTNFLQMQIQKGLGSLRFLPLLVFLVIGLIVGGRLIVEIELNTVSIIIAISIIFAALVNFFGFRINNIDVKYERPITSILGFFSGILGGLSTFYGPPILTYLISVNLSKEFFIRTIATMYFIGSIPLYGSLLYHDLGTLNDLFVSLFLIVPALIGQYFGTKIRHKLSNEIFRKSILITLMILGLILLFKNF